MSILSGFRFYMRNRRLLLAVIKLWLIGVFGASISRNDSFFQTKIMGLHINNPIGLAAGIDRMGALLNGVSKAGYGFLEVGSVTPKSAEIARNNLEKGRVDGIAIPVGANIMPEPGDVGAAAISGYLVCARILLPSADYLVLNFSSPKRCASIDDQEWVDQLLSRVIEMRDQFWRKTQRRVPVAAKIAVSPELSSAQCQLLKCCQNHALDGVVIVSSAEEDEERHCRLLNKIKDAVKQIEVISVGGIADYQQVANRLYAGASAVQVFSSVLSRGVLLPGSMLRDVEPHCIGDQECE